MTHKIVPGVKVTAGKTFRSHAFPRRPAESKVPGLGTPLTWLPAPGRFVLARTAVSAAFSRVRVRAGLAWFGHAGPGRPIQAGVNGACR